MKFWQIKLTNDKIGCRCQDFKRMWQAEQWVPGKTIRALMSFCRAHNEIIISTKYSLISYLNAVCGWRTLLTVHLVNMPSHAAEVGQRRRPTLAHHLLRAVDLVVMWPQPGRWDEEEIKSDRTDKLMNEWKIEMDGGIEEWVMNEKKVNEWIDEGDDDGQ